MSYFRWVPGRQQNCDYKKKKLWEFGSKRFNKFSDCYLVKYPANARLPKHTDPVRQGKHIRINVQLMGKGQFGIDGPHKKFGPIVIFRPDVNPHWMTNLDSERLILSLGFVI